MRWGFDFGGGLFCIANGVWILRRPLLEVKDTLESNDQQLPPEEQRKELCAPFALAAEVVGSVRADVG